MIFAYVFGLLLFTVVFTREVIAPASGANCDKRWRIFAGSINAANTILIVATGFFFEDFFRANSIFSVSQSLNPIAAGLLSFLVASFVAYWWHRLTHYSDTLWRVFHQLHHSPKRIEALTAFYAHPLDSIIATLINGAVSFLVLGVDVVAAVISMCLVSVFNLVAHADQKSPYWLGYIIQRPEMHRVHHESGSHRNNYGLPLWDIIFGTWVNPRVSDVECGFEQQKANKIKEMLLFEDVRG
jgi:sterol desaturase/sphingolipid hydroxylase (fatty acid hydroxylase superfamily)